MLKKLLPVVLSLAAFLGGAAGGEMLRRDAHATPDAAVGANDTPAPTQGGQAEADDPPAEGGHGERLGGHDKAGHHSPAGAGTAWFKFPQQFLIPILHDGRLDSTMILTLSVEMPAAASETVYAHELKLRDALLRQLLIHANTGGFDGNFTSEAQMRKLRETLTATAQGVVPEIAAILIGDIARQER